MVDKPSGVDEEDDDDDDGDADDDRRAPITVAGDINLRAHKSFSFCFPDHLSVAENLAVDRDLPLATGVGFHRSN